MTSSNYLIMGINMGKKIKTARGLILDFDLFKIKEQMASKPTPHTVKLREDFIDARLKRRVKRTAANIAETRVSAPVPSELKTVEELAAVDKEMDVEEDDSKVILEEETVDIKEALAAVDEEDKKQTPRKTIRKRKPEENKE